MPLTGPEHYRAAEKLLSRASFERSERNPAPSLDPQATALLIARAQVHATLAATASQEADVVKAHIHDDHDSAFEPSCWACVDEARASVDAHVHGNQDAAFDPSCRECAEGGEWAAANVLAEIRLHEEALSHYVGTFTVAEEIAPNHILRWEALRILLRERNALLKAREAGAS